MRYLIVNHNQIDRNQFIESSVTGDPKLHFQEIFHLMHFSCIEMSEHMFQIYYKEWPNKYREVTEQQAKNGSNFFSEVRPYGKVLSTESGEGWSYTPANPQQKIEVELTPEITKQIVEFMQIFAVEIIEDEFNTRFKVLRNSSDLEAASWEIQKHEAREWLTYGNTEGHITPFLDYLCEEHGKDKTEYANKILQKSEEYEDKLSTMLVDMQKIIKKFENATTIWDLNILYEDYMGIIMPTSQAIELGRTVSETDWERKPEYEVNVYVFKF